MSSGFAALGNLDANSNVIISHHLNAHPEVYECTPFYKDKDFMAEHILKPVDAAKVPRNLKMLLPPPFGLDSPHPSFFCQGNMECRLGVSKFALLEICFPSCCCTLVGRCWQVFFPPRDGDDDEDAVGSPVRTIKIIGTKGDAWLCEDAKAWLVEWKKTKKPEKSYSPSWSGWMPRNYTLRTCTGHSVGKFILAQRRGSEDVCWWQFQLTVTCMCVCVCKLDLEKRTCRRIVWMESEFDGKREAWILNTQVSDKVRDAYLSKDTYSLPR